MSGEERRANLQKVLHGKGDSGSRQNSELETVDLTGESAKPKRRLLRRSVASKSLQNAKMDKKKARGGQKRKISNYQDLSPKSQIIPRKRKKGNLSSAGGSRMISMNSADDDCDKAYRNSGRRDSIFEEPSDDYPGAEVLDSDQEQESPRRGTARNSRVDDLLFSSDDDIRSPATGSTQQENCHKKKANAIINNTSQVEKQPNRKNLSPNLNQGKDGSLNLNFSDEGENPTNINNEPNRTEKSQRSSDLSDEEFTLTLGDVKELEEGEEPDWTKSSDFKGEDDPLLLAIKAQNERHSRDGPLERSAASIASNLSRASTTAKRNSRVLGNLKEEWIIEYQRKSKDFFSSAEARMEIDQRIEQREGGVHRATAYKGVKLNDTNNSDLKYMYNLEFRQRTLGDRAPLDTYYNFTTCMGQLARVGISLDVFDIDNLWKPGEFFKAAENMSFIKFFVKHFTRTSTPATVMNKEAQLLKYVNSAHGYFDIHSMHPNNQMEHSAMRERIKNVAVYLKADKNVHKSSTRRIRAKTKEDWHRSSVGKFVSLEMFDSMRERVIDALRGLKNTFEDIFSEKSAEDVPSKRKVFEKKILEQENLLLKWTLNFVVLLLLFGNGQRPQVYTFLKCPTVIELEIFQTQKGGSEARVPLQLMIHEDEKRSRDSRMPYVLLDPKTFDFVHFHVMFVHNFILQRHEVPIGSVGSEKLLLDTRNGRPMASGHIRTACRPFSNKMDPELYLNPMDIRSSYATIMIRRHIQRNEGEKNEPFLRLSENDFVAMLSCVMNTSEEQIRSVYAASPYSEFPEQVARMLGMCRD